MDEIRAALAGEIVQVQVTPRPNKVQRHTIHYSSIVTALPAGIGARVHLLEISLHAGLPAFEISGLPSGQGTALKARITAAIKNSGFRFPDQRIVCAVTPDANGARSDTLDLPAALAVLAASGQIHIPEGVAAIGQLSLLGNLEVAAAVFNPLRALAAAGVERVLLTVASASEAALHPEGVRLVATLGEAAGLLSRAACWQQIAQTIDFHCSDGPDASLQEIDLVELPGQQLARHALQLAAAGGHHVIMLGGTGCGKTSLSRLAHALLPDLSDSERELMYSLYSAAGRSDEISLNQRPPWRAVNYQVTDAALLGGGSWPAPGEVSLAHNGVLFLDELTEFTSSQLDRLRSCLSEGQIRLQRSKADVLYPAAFLLVGACNPCPCGHYLSTELPCHCSAAQIRGKIGKLSGPFKDRVDIWVCLQSLPGSELSRTISQAHLLPIAELRDTVEQARLRQQNRAKLAGLPMELALNSRVPATRIREIFALTDESIRLAESLTSRHHLSVRAYQQLLRVARTAADLQGSAEVSAAAVGMAFQFHADLPLPGLGGQT